MLIPHDQKNPFRVNIPWVGLFAAGIFFLVGVAYIVSSAAYALEYQRMKATINYYTAQFIEMEETMNALKKSEEEFRKLFSVNKKEEVLENFVIADGGSIDVDALKREIALSMETVKEIQTYLSDQKDIYEATPKGLPADGYISSRFGTRIHPISQRRDFHSGVDIMASSGNPVRATAKGIVSFAGRSGGNGNLVVLEHGQGFSTIYAHNKKIFVKTGQVVKRGDLIASIGSTGISTGPHVHYEIWKRGKAVNPAPYIEVN
jgi:murein DD-endopeptidase MepM/ murein hydrolase activator NlpD